MTKLDPYTLFQKQVADINFNASPEEILSHMTGSADAFGFRVDVGFLPEGHTLGDRFKTGVVSTNLIDGSSTIIDVYIKTPYSPGYKITRFSIYSPRPGDYLDQLDKLDLSPIQEFVKREIKKGSIKVLTLSTAVMAENLISLRKDELKDKIISGLGSRYNIDDIEVRNNRDGNYLGFLYQGKPLLIQYNVNAKHNDSPFGFILKLTPVITLWSVDAEVDICGCFLEKALLDTVEELKVIDKKKTMEKERKEAEEEEKRKKELRTPVKPTFPESAVRHEGDVSLSDIWKDIKSWLKTK